MDDDPGMREMLRVHLCNAGYFVSMAEDAVVAGRLMLTMPPDLLIIDVEMPYLDGIEFELFEADSAPGRRAMLFEYPGQNAHEYVL